MTIGWRPYLSRRTVLWRWLMTVGRQPYLSWRTVLWRRLMTIGRRANQPWWTLLWRWRCFRFNHKRECCTLHIERRDVFSRMNRMYSCRPTLAYRNCYIKATTHIYLDSLARRS